MFTVIIADKKTIGLYHELSTFVKPLLHDDVVFCQWNRDGKDLTEMLPELYGLIEFHKQWRAVIVDRSGSTQVNPFDHVLHKDPQVGPARGEALWPALDTLRAARFESFERATEDPLTRLSAALCGATSFNYTIGDEEQFRRIVSGETPLYEYMLKSQLKDLNLTEAANRLDMYGRQDLQRFVPEDSVGLLIDAVRHNDAAAIVSYIGVGAIVEFINYIGDSDLLHSDPDLNERLVENTYKAKLFARMLRDYSLKDRLPQEVVCVAPRTFDYENYIQAVDWEAHDENDYSRFAEYNLYHDKMKYIVFDIVQQDNKQYLSDQLRMMSFLLVLASNPLPKGAMKTQRVYRADLRMDEGVLKTIFSDYLGKLKATSSFIREMSLDIDRNCVGRLDRRTVEEIFESEISIPVEITEFSRGEMYAEYDKLGLARDCPEDERSVWAARFKTIEKRFVRYMREPQRVLKKAARTDLLANNKIVDERAHQLDNDQREDIELKMLEEEQSMVSENTPQIFRLDGYRKQMRDADRKLRQTIERRMTRKRAVLVGVISAAVYLFGFLPWIVGNLNTTRSLLYALFYTGVAVLGLLVSGLVYLILMKRKARSEYKRFNDVINQIFYSVETGLARFSSYLSHACNMMRESSVLHMSGSQAVTKKRILALHDTQICDTADEAVELFSKFIDPEELKASDADPYDYDYTVMEHYDYPIPYSNDPRKIDFMQAGNTISVSADFVVSISLDRVELYD